MSARETRSHEPTRRTGTGKVPPRSSSRAYDSLMPKRRAASESGTVRASAVVLMPVWPASPRRAR